MYAGKETVGGRAKLDHLQKITAEFLQWTEQLPDLAPLVVAAFEKDGKRGIEDFLKNQSEKMRGRISALEKLF